MKRYKYFSLSKGKCVWISKKRQPFSKILRSSQLLIAIKLQYTPFKNKVLIGDIEIAWR